MTTTDARDEPRIHPAWWVAAVTMAALMAAAGFRSSTGALLVPLEEDFGWSRSTTSGAVSLNLIVYGLTAPFAAALMERFGIRRVVAAVPDPGRRRLRPDAGDDQPVAAVAAVGLRDRHRHRFAGAGVRRGRRQPLVRRAPRRRDRRLLRGQLHRPAGLPAGHRQPRRRSRLALGRRLVTTVFAALLVPLRPVAAARPSEPTSARRRTAPAGAARRARRRRPGAPPGSRSTRPAGEHPQPHVLDPLRHVLDLRLVDQRPDRHPLHPGRARPRDAGLDQRRAARADRRLRHHRHGGERLAHRPGRQPLPALRLLLLPRPLAARGAVAARPARAPEPVPLHPVLRPRLGGDRAADRRAVPAALRDREGRASSSAGCSPRTWSAPGWRPASPAGSASGAATTSAPG